MHNKQAIDFTSQSKHQPSLIKVKITTLVNNRWLLSDKNALLQQLLIKKTTQPCAAMQNTTNEIDSSTEEWIAPSTLTIPANQIKLFTRA